MKICEYCGLDYSDDVVRCRVCYSYLKEIEASNWIKLFESETPFLAKTARALLESQGIEVKGEEKSLYSAIFGSVWVRASQLSEAKEILKKNCFI